MLSLPLDIVELCPESCSCSQKPQEQEEEGDGHIVHIEAATSADGAAITVYFGGGFRANTLVVHISCRWRREQKKKTDNILCGSDHIFTHDSEDELKAHKNTRKI